MKNSRKIHRDRCWIDRKLTRPREVAEQSPQRMRDVIEEYNKNYTHLNDHKLIQALEKHYSQDREEVAEQSPQQMRDVIEEYNKTTHI